MALTVPTPPGSLSVRNYGSLRIISSLEHSLILQMEMNAASPEWEFAFGFFPYISENYRSFNAGAARK